MLGPGSSLKKRLLITFQSILKELLYSTFPYFGLMVVIYISFRKLLIYFSFTSILQSNF